MLFKLISAVLSSATYACLCQSWEHLYKIDIFTKLRNYKFLRSATVTALWTGASPQTTTIKIVCLLFNLQMMQTNDRTPVKHINLQVLLID